MRVSMVGEKGAAVLLALSAHEEWAGTAVLGKGTDAKTLVSLAETGLVDFEPAGKEEVLRLTDDGRKVAAEGPHPKWATPGRTSLLRAIALAAEGTSSIGGKALPKADLTVLAEAGVIAVEAREGPRVGKTKPKVVVHAAATEEGRAWLAGPGARAPRPASALAVLVALDAEGGAAANGRLKTMLGKAPTKKDLDALHGLVEATTRTWESRARLSEAGWGWLNGRPTASLEPSATTAGRAIEAALRHLEVMSDASGMTIADTLAARRGEGVAGRDVDTVADEGADDGEVEARVLAAYSDAAGGKEREFVDIGAIRSRLHDVGRDQLDRLLRAMHKRGGEFGLVRIEADYKVTPGQREGACEVNGLSMHMAVVTR